MEHQGQHGHATNQATEYGNPVAAGHGATGVGAAGGQMQHMKDDPKTNGVLRRSGSSSSSSSSEDDGMGGRRKKGIKEKIKEKLPGGNKGGSTETVGQQGQTGATGTGVHGTDGTGEKKGLMGKIKEKLPGQH